MKTTNKKLVSLQRLKEITPLLLAKDTLWLIVKTTWQHFNGMKKSKIYFSKEKIRKIFVKSSPGMYKVIELQITGGKNGEKNFPLYVSEILSALPDCQGIILHIPEKWLHWRGCELIKEKKKEVFITLLLTSKMLQELSDEEVQSKLAQYKMGVDYILIN